MDSLPKGESYNTVAGLILYKLRKIPKKGDKVEINNLPLIVEDVDERRIRKVRIVFKGNGS